MIIFALLTTLPYLVLCWLSRRINGPLESVGRKISPSLLFGILLAASAALILSTSFIQDDAYISFRYARNLAAGNGMVWNVGDDQPVQGYTNFLWTALMTLPIGLGISVEEYIKVLGIAIGLLTIIFAYRFAADLFKSRRKALVPALLLSTNYSFLAYCTGGLETQLVALLATICWYIAYRAVNQKSENNLDYLKGIYSQQASILLISVVAGLAFLTRPDSVLISVPCIAYTTTALFRDGSVRCWNILPPLTLPFATILAAKLSFSYFYYGSILPNTFYIKADSFSLINLKLGAFYLLQFLVFYGLIPIIFLLVFRVLSARHAIHLSKVELIYWFLGSAVLLTWLYSLRVGGDFMEFRFLVPIMPIFFILLSKSIISLAPKYAFIILICLPFFSAINFLFSLPRLYGVESIRQLNNHIFHPSENWIGIAKSLNSIFPDSPKDVTIGITPAGVIPYYSGLKSIDLLGLNDRYIARDGVVIGSRPGHTRGPRLNYLYRSNINLLIGHPQVRAVGTPFSSQSFNQSFCWFMDQKDCQSLANSDHKVISMKIDSKHILDMLYMSPSKAIDEAIKMNLLSITHGGSS
jgi:arabinofuranosyltransferase